MCKKECMRYEWEIDFTDQIKAAKNRVPEKEKTEQSGLNLNTLTFILTKTQREQ